MPPEAREKLLTQVPPHKLKKHYLKFRHWLFGEDYPRQPKNAKKILVYALKKFQGLSTVHFPQTFPVPYRTFQRRCWDL
jgi:hypothetical protein